MREVWILAAKRTPIGRFLGGFQSLTAIDLGVQATLAVAEAAKDNGGFDALASADTVVFGCARQAGLGPNPARQVGIRAGVPVDRTAFTVNMACASGLKAATIAAGAIAGGEINCAIVGGMESMTNVPFFVMPMRAGVKLGHVELTDGMYQDGFHCPLSDMVMGKTADLLAEELGISRMRADAYACVSQSRYQEASARGQFGPEIVPVVVPGRRGQTTCVDRDEHPRAGVNVDKLAKLPSVFGDGGVTTAGNASGINDGAAALVLAEGEWARERGCKPLAILRGWSEAALEPKRMGLGPVPAVEKLLASSDYALSDFDHVELNEAFAVQVLACLERLDIQPQRVNPFGGAIALGHPIGCTGARLLVTLAHGLVASDAQLGLATLCVSGGLGMAAVIERS